MGKSESAIPTTKMTESQRRLIDAAVAEMVEVGYAGLSIEGVLDRAGISRSSFNATFSSRQALVEAAYASLFERFIHRLAQTCQSQARWPLKVKVGIGVTLDLAAASPVEARFLSLQSLAVDPALARQGIESRDRLSRLLVPGRTEIPGGAALPGITEQVLVAGIAGVISSQLIRGEAEHLPSLAPQLVEFTLLPYLGAKEAAEVARRPRPPIKEL
jgi:AcrR family transcriptional regulator